MRVDGVIVSHATVGLIPAEAKCFLQYAAEYIWLPIIRCIPNFYFINGISAAGSYWFE